MLNKSIHFLIIFIFSLILNWEIEAAEPQKKALGDDKVKRTILSFLDPNSLGRLTYTKKDFSECVKQMDFFIENKKFLITISGIKGALSNIEFLGPDQTRIREIKNNLLRLHLLIMKLCPSVMIKTVRIIKYNLQPKDGIIYYYPCYNPEFHGNKAKNQALEKTIESKRAELQQLFIRAINISLPPISPKSQDLLFAHFFYQEVVRAIAISTLADFETIKTRISGILPSLICWAGNPNMTPESYENFIRDWAIHGSFSRSASYLIKIFANPVSPEKTIQEYFERLLETTAQEKDGGGTILAKKLAFATGIALNPIAISKFGSRLLKWLIQNEQRVLPTECRSSHFHEKFIHELYFPLSALIFNLNLPKTTSQEVLNYLFFNLKQLAVDPIHEGYLRSWDFHENSNKNTFLYCSKWDLFCEFLMNFARTAHGSEVILENIEAILLEPHFGLKLKENLIQSLYAGFDWDYYFKNYSIDHDVKRPAEFPEKTTEAILEWLSKIPQANMPFQILEEMVSRGKLSPQGIDQALDILIENPDEDFKTQVLIKLIKKASLHPVDHRRILMISTFFSEESKWQIQEAYWQQ